MARSPHVASAVSTAPFLSGGGEMGARMRAFDWESTPLGPPERWSQSLKTAVRIMLTSRQPMFVWWGAELLNLYNDAYRSIVGGKHPGALGTPARIVWREIWDQILPRAESAMRRNEGTYDESLLLIMERNGYPEETYYTFSYSPVPDDSGETGGILCANTDDTRRIIGERQLDTLRRLAAETADVRNIDDVCAKTAAALESNRRDLPFAAVYLADDSGRTARRAAATGLRDDDVLPRAAHAGDGIVGEAIRRREPVEGEAPEGIALKLADAAWPLPPARMIAIPIAGRGRETPAAVFVAGLSPVRLFDDAYRGFVELAAAQIGAGLSNAQAYEDERRRSEALAELDRAKTAFFSNVSHEFRTPLTLLLGPLDDLLDRGPEALADGAEVLSGMRRNGRRLLKLVNTLLDFSRIEAGRMSATFVPVDLAALTAEIASVFRSTIEKAGMRLAVEAPGPEPAWVDRDLWEKIVLNLISNAFKHTFEGEISVSCRAAGDAIETIVRDTGVGIPAAERDRIFDRFHRIEGARGRTHEGSGIGLALVRELVRLHGGEISVESVPGRGATFSVRIPKGYAHLPPAQVGGARVAELPGLGAESFVDEARGWLRGTKDDTGTRRPLAAEGPAPASSGRVLLADDNADIREYVGRLLEGAGYAVEAVSDGAAALAAARRNPPDLILTDVMMPGRSGFDLLAEVRREPSLRETPVVLLSARAGEEARLDGLRQGADEYLVKPFSARELIGRVGTVLTAARSRAAEKRFLREADRRKNEFLATLAHELRNPLAPLVHSVEVMRRSAEDPERRESARAVIERQLAQLARLVDDLLDLARINHGTLALRREAFDLARAVDAAIETTRPLFEKSGRTLAVEWPDRPLRVDGDLARLAQVFTNLLHNAAKYTEPGGHVRVRVRAEEGRAVISVADDGIGIPADRIGGIFEMFAQTAQARERSQGGLGIGLSIARRLVEMHDGSIEASSGGAGAGSEFTVRLPIAAAAPRGVERSAEPAAGVRLCAVVADDNDDSVQSLRALLELSGHEVRIARDGFEAVDACRGAPPDIAFLDVGMPRMGGLEAARRIRADAGGARIFLVALSGWGQAEDLVRSREAGFDLHLVKPARAAAIEGAVRQAAERRRATGAK